MPHCPQSEPLIKSLDGFCQGLQVTLLCSHNCSNTPSAALLRTHAVTSLPLSSALRYIPCYVFSNCDRDAERQEVGCYRRLNPFRPSFTTTLFCLLLMPSSHFSLPTVSEFQLPMRPCRSSFASAFFFSRKPINFCLFLLLSFHIHVEFMISNVLRNAMKLFIHSTCLIRLQKIQNR